MAVAGTVYIRPVGNDPNEVIVHCEDNGLRKPLTRCTSKELGNYGEELASILLESQNYHIQERNWRSSFGEVDIVAEDDQTVVLVEVKTRICSPKDARMPPELGVTYRKRNKYQKLALVYLSLHSRVQNIRFDVVAICLTGNNDAYVRHYTRAYEWDD